MPESGGKTLQLVRIEITVSTRHGGEVEHAETVKRVRKLEGLSEQGHFTKPDHPKHY